MPNKQKSLVQKLAEILQGNTSSGDTSSLAQLPSSDASGIPTPQLPDQMPAVNPMIVPPTPRQHAQQAHAMATAVQHGANSQVLNQARQSMDHESFIGLCEKFVEQATRGVTGLFASAADAWNKQTHQTDMSKIQPGDAVYFAPDKSNNNYGHTGVYLGNGKMQSATYNGIQTSDINQWKQSTGQKILGFVKHTNPQSLPSTAPLRLPQTQKQQGQPLINKTVQKY